MLVAMCVSRNQINPLYISTMVQLSDKWFVEMMKNVNGTSQPTALYAVGTASMLTQHNTRNAFTH